MKYYFRFNRILWGFATAMILIFNNVSIANADIGAATIQTYKDDLLKIAQTILKDYCLSASASSAQDSQDSGNIDLSALATDTTASSSKECTILITDLTTTQ
jgi:hypothetical protein